VVVHHHRKDSRQRQLGHEQRGGDAGDGDEGLGGSVRSRWGDCDAEAACARSESIRGLAAGYVKASRRGAGPGSPRPCPSR
jgi:hypothetical protein